MAVKNHELDDKIVAAARQEFLEKGFRGASLHQIAARAGITTGALYTRYKNKDALFCSLVQELMEEIQKRMAGLHQEYDHVQTCGDPSRILQVIHQEELVYRELLVHYRDECVLMFCKSDGSSLETMLRSTMEMKASQTVEYLKSVSKSDLDLDGAGMLISQQFHLFRQMLDRQYSVEKTISCMKTMECYMEAGWQALFKAIL